MLAGDSSRTGFGMVGYHIYILTGVRCLRGSHFLGITFFGYYLIICVHMLFSGSMYIPHLRTYC